MRKNIAISTVFVWIGFIGAISFMEAWMKFKAPGVTLPIGLGIGRLVFAALNKMEWGCLLIVLYALFPYKNVSKKSIVILLVAGVFLLLQTLWTLPTLDARALAFISETPPPASKIHLIHVILEFLKVVALLFVGFSLFTDKKNENKFSIK